MLMANYLGKNNSAPTGKPFKGNQQALSRDVNKGMISRSVIGDDRMGGDLNTNVDRRGTTIPGNTSNPSTSSS